MTKRMVIDCDRCDAKALAEPIEISVCVGYESCPAGGPAERDMRYLDLCPKCAAFLLTGAVSTMSEQGAFAWYTKAKEKVKSR